MSEKLTYEELIKLGTMSNINNNIALERALERLKLIALEEIGKYRNDRIDFILSSKNNKI